MSKDFHRVTVHARARPDCQFWVGRADSWEPVRSVDGVLRYADGRPVAMSTIEAFAVAYPNGQLLDGEFGELGPPEGTRRVDHSWAGDDVIIPVAEFESAADVVRVEFDVSDVHPDDPIWYSTSLTNLAAEPIFVESFSPATLTSVLGMRQRLQIGRRYNADEFASWYGAPDARIDPGATVADHANWGETPIAWVYRCRRASGTRLLAGALLHAPLVLPRN